MSWNGQMPLSWADESACRERYAESAVIRFNGTAMTPEEYRQFCAQFRPPVHARVEEMGPVYVTPDLQTAVGTVPHFLCSYRMCPRGQGLTMPPEG